jgi:hypothetical protein
MSSTCPTPQQIGQRLERVRTEPAPRRGVVGTILLYRIKDTDRIVRQHPLITMAGGVLLFYSLFAVIMSVLERVMG